jgi:NifU-like protein involved in Fe-S cluster formation
VNDQSRYEVSTTCVSGWVKHHILSYSESFKDHIANPRNPGELSNANAVGEETNPVCGDRLRLSLHIRDGKIEAARFLAYGCPPTLACGSALAEMLEGMSLEEARALTKEQIVKAAGGLPSRKHHAAALAIETLRAALARTTPSIS